MRNDSHDDLNLVSGLRATSDDDQGPLQAEPVAKAYVATAPAAGTGASGFLWALVLLLTALVGGLIWWGQGQLAQINAQMIATQDSFAQTSEVAAGQIQDITGKVVANESTLTAERESLKLRIKQLETQQAEGQKQWQALSSAANALRDQQVKLEKDLSAQAAAASASAEALKKAEQGQSALQAELTALKRAQPQLEPISAELAALKQELVELKKADASAALRRVEQDLFLLRSELDSRQSTQSEQSSAEFDAFRGQVTRNINTLQSQVQNLQQQLDARH